MLIFIVHTVSSEIVLCAEGIDWSGFGLVYFCVLHDSCLKIYAYWDLRLILFQ